jgi:hypothetical protein
MDAKSEPSSAKKSGTAVRRTPGHATTAAVEPTGPADRACCCASKAAVRVTMPPTATRPHQTDLLLCGHHYRVSRRALEAAQAIVRELPGTSREIAAWIDRARLAAFTDV